MFAFTNRGRARNAAREAWKYVEHSTLMCDICSGNINRGEGYLCEESTAAFVVDENTEELRRISPYSPDLICEACFKEHNPKAWKGPIPGSKSKTVSSTAKKGTSGFFVFDYNEMETNYGQEAFKAISAALKGSTGTCDFCDGDVPLDTLREFVQQAAHVVPKNQGSPLSDAANALSFGPYLAAMWTDNGRTYDMIHSYLVRTGTQGYLGYLTLNGKYEHLAFVQEMGSLLGLPTGIAFVDGSVVSETSKYGVKNTADHSLGGMNESSLLEKEAELHKKEAELNKKEEEIRKHESEIREKSSENTDQLYCPSCKYNISRWRSRFSKVTEVQQNRLKSGLCPMCENKLEIY